MNVGGKGSCTLFVSCNHRGELDGTIRCVFTIPCGCNSDRLTPFQVKHIPAATQQPRYLFILTSSLRAACHLVFFEVARLYVWYNPACSSVTLGTRSYVARCADTIAFIGLTYWALNACYFAMAAGSVALGLHEPRMWPDLFGSWRDGYTVRRAWG